MSLGNPSTGNGQRSPFVSYRPFLEVLEDRTVPSFLAAGSYAVGSNPAAVAVGDFNNDAIADLVVANGHSDTVSILLGKADGTFLPAQSYPAGKGPFSLAVADFNRDGNLDVGVSLYVSDMVTILLGNGDGTLQAPQSYAAGLDALSLAVGDFNSDHLPDLAVAGFVKVGILQRQRGTLGILLGNGDGTFQVANTFADGYPDFVTVADLNGDGADDLVTKNVFRDRTGDFAEKDIRVLLGKGDGTFPATQSYQDGSVPTSVAVGDFNGDGIPDLAEASYVWGTGPLLTSVLLGKGDGTFQPASSHALPFGAGSTVVGDFNDDGKLDLAGVGGGTGVGLLLGTGAGDFRDLQRYDAGADPSALVVDDFNDDGFPDLAVTNEGPGTVTVLLNAADWWPVATFRLTAPASVVAGVPFDVTVTALDAYGHVVTAYTGTVHLGSTDPYPGILPAEYSFTAADHGVHTFSGVTLFTAGGQTLGVQDQSNSALTGSATIPVSAAPADHFLLTAPPSAFSGVPFDLTIAALDHYGNVATNYTGTVAFASSDSAAGVLLPADYTFQVTDSGMHTFTGIVALITPGDQTVTAIDTENGIDGTATITVVLAQPPGE